MQSMKELAEEYGNIWIYCKSEELQIRFLKQSEKEGFLALNGQKPTELFHHQLYGMFDDMTMGYLSGLVWCYSARNKNDSHIRIDFEKYVSGNPDIFYHIIEKDMEYELYQVDPYEMRKIN